MAVVILMFHEIVSPENTKAGNVYTITTNVWEQILALIGALQIPVLSLDDLHSGLQRQSLPATGVVLTFDDGLVGNYRYAYPALKERSWPGVFYVSPAYVGLPNYIDWPGLKEMARSGFAIQSHAHSHRRLETLSPQEVETELSQSKAILEEKLGLPITGISLPGGGIPKHLEKLARTAGYQTVANSVPALVTPATSPLALPRIAIRRGQTLAEIENFLTGDPQALGHEYRKYLWKNWLKQFLPTGLFHKTKS